MDKKVGPILAGVGVAGALLWSLLGTSKADENKPAEGCKSPPQKDPQGRLSTSGGAQCARPGVASNPDFQWRYIVKPGDSPAAITMRFLGGDYIPGIAPTYDKPFPHDRKSWDYAVVELIDANPSKPTVGDRLNPASRTPRYNFASLMPGEELLIPKSWNPFIDEQGTPRGSTTPFPKG